MLTILADGLPHRREELHACLPDDLGDLSNIKAHLTAIRKAIRPQGRDVACELLGGVICYRLVRLIASACDGTR